MIVVKCVVGSWGRPGDPVTYGTRLVCSLEACRLIGQ